MITNVEKGKCEGKEEEKSGVGWEKNEMQTLQQKEERVQTQIGLIHTPDVMT